MDYYLRIEGVNLGNFVYDTQDLSTIRGSGLAILKSVNLLANKEFEINGEKIKLSKISSGASAGLFSFSTEAKITDENILKKEISNFLQDFSYKYKTESREVDIFPFRYANFVINIINVTDSSEDDFLVNREKVLAKNRWQQMQSPSLSIPAYSTEKVENFKRVSCKVDSLRRAEIKTNFKSEEKEISQSIFHRRRYGFDQKQNFVEQEIQNYYDLVNSTNSFAWDFDDITFGKNDALNSDKDKGNLHHKMAVIYLDGNDFGKKQKDLSIKELKEFDKIKIDYQRKFLAKLIEKVELDKKGWQFTQKKENGDDETLYQLEILLWGGDEICLVVPAWKGWETVQLFYEKTKDLYWGDEELTHAVGMVFCHHNAPIRRIKNLAENLAGLAKQKSRDKNYFAYEILESFDHISKNLEEHRKSRCPQIEPTDINLTILEGNKMKETSESLRSLKSFYPRRKLTEIVIKLLTKVENDQEKSEQKIAIDELLQGTEKTINEDNLEKLKEFIELFENGKYVALINALELWDYIEEAD